MSFVVWLGYKLTGGTSSAVNWCGIVIAALVFGVGHLPALFAIAPEVTVSLIFYIMVANSTLGILFGWLFWKKGIESAMVAHIFTHVAFLAVGPLLA